ncbi:hypothetical protein [Streptomyces sp. NPDC051567]|uniref:hypothetical protein n=1 Tax=Streptomyces sp. NPDC051567 TaxID=3365660 RepID=UPI0037997E2C
MSRRTMTDWLAGSHHQPGQVRAEWRERGISVLPVGHRFDAVRLPEPLVHAAVHPAVHAAGAPAGPCRAPAGTGLAGHLDGPVIHDGRGRTYYALVPPGTATTWRAAAPGVTCLGPGTHLGVPAEGLLEYHPAHPVHWTAATTRRRHCDPASVALLVRAGTARLAEAAGHPQGCSAGRPGLSPRARERPCGHLR